MHQNRIILENPRFALTIERLCHQLIEKHANFENSCIIGLQSSGVLLAERIQQQLLEILPVDTIEHGKLDVTFYRDDFRMRDKPLKASPTEMNFLVDGKRVILVDDVLYTGRTIRAALTAIQHYGRPAQIDLLCLIDRRFNRHLPIQANYVGMTIDAMDESYVKVQWADEEGEDKVMMYHK